jgi:hypothetical protein
MIRKTILLMILFLAVHFVLAETETPKPSVDESKIAQLETNVEEWIVQKKEYSSALQEYATAAKANPQVPYYRDQYAILRRVIKLKQLLAEETNAEKWKSYSVAVRAYYYSKGYYSESQELDLATAKKFETAEFAVNVLETLLMTDQNEEAVKFLETQKFTEKPVRYQTLEAVLLARTEKTEEALNAVKTIQLVPKTNAMSYFDLARVYWAAGDKEKAFSSLTVLMEHTAPSEQPVVQILIQRSREFAPLQGTEEMKTILATKSKVSQSGCTGGSSCGSCSLKDKCASGSK